MPGSKRHPRHCKVCQKSDAEVGRISQRGYCIEHGVARSVEQLTSMHRFDGEDATRWRRAIAASVGAVLLDDVQDAS